MQLYQIVTQTHLHLPGLYNLYSVTLGQGCAQLVEDLRQEKAFLPELSLVACSDEVVLAHALFCDLKTATLTGSKIKMAVLAPMAVLPQCQRLGIGSALVQQGLTRLRQQGYLAVVVLGDVNYYGRFGFSLDLGSKIKCPYSGQHLLAMELEPGVLSSEKRIVALYPKSFNTSNF